MDKINFFSSNAYIFLPKKNNYKVALIIDNSALAQNAFKLYNPFSSKAKLLKKISQFLFINFNGLAKIVWQIKPYQQSAFVSYLESKLRQSLVASVYLSTTQDKVVIQLQTPDAKIVGYLKYPLNEIGLHHLENEKKAIEILSNNNIVNQYVLYDMYDEKPFLLLEALEGEIGLVEKQYIEVLLLGFLRKETYLLANHPRITEIKKDVVDIGLECYLPQIEKVCDNSKMQYALVYEHGDFTPWNIVNVKGSYIPFDFEHFVEDGLEYFDLVKYYYQIGKLLNQLDTATLITFISEQIEIKEIKTILQLFLIKEIIRNKEENESYEFEANMLEMMSKQ